jgi:hypothetical protein
VNDYPEAAHAASEFTDDVPDRWSTSTEMADALAELLVFLFASMAVASFIAVVWP